MPSSNKQNVVIVGGGCVGLNTWNALSAKLDAKTHDLVLVTDRPYFTYLPASIRMVVTTDGKLEDSVFMPLTESKYNTGNKKLIVGSVTSIVEQENQGGYLVLDNGEKVEYSALVLAPGSIWDGPFALPSGTKAEISDAVNSWRSRFAEAQNIVIVGAGAVGLELAGEIKDLGGSKNVTIVHGPSQVLNKAYKDSYRSYTAKQYQARDINLVLGDYVDDMTINNGSITTRHGKSIPADLVVSARGARPNTKFAESLTGALSSSGALKVTPTLQVVGHPRIFAGGDAIEWDEQKQAAKAPNHAAVIAQNVLSLLGLNKKALTLYKGSAEMIIVTNGKNGGTGYFGILWGIVVGNWLSATLKSKTLMVDMAKKSLGMA